ncbi:hypothetical protein BD769DRAFT_1393544 [Suillus cothurnatus]|nr:hypothetical protein BD769DRAFT_1393544 [Suillus cothurnatus]
MPTTQINKLLDLWALTLMKHKDGPPFTDYRDLYKTINNISVGDVKWQSFSAQYTGVRPDVVPSWMDQKFNVWYQDLHEVVRNMLANPDYIQEFDYCPYCEFSTDGNLCQWKDFMSSDWAWDQADLIARDPQMHRSTVVPVVQGSDKTTPYLKPLHILSINISSRCPDPTLINAPHHTSSVSIYPSLDALT